MTCNVIATGLDSYITLNDGVEMPMFGLGTSKAFDSEVFTEAFNYGYKLIDTAQGYGNEELVGEAIRKSQIPREKLFVVSKVFRRCHGVKKCTKSLEESLQKLGTGYIDMVLIHSPAGGKILDTYDTIQKFKERGLVRSVGVSNFGVHHLEGLRQNGRVQPSVNQIELSVKFRQQEIVDYCVENNIGVMGYSPLSKWTQAENSALLDMANRYDKTLAQLMIRWSVQKGYITIPKTSNPARLAENADVFNFSISEKDMTTLGSLEEEGCAWHPNTCEWKP